MASRLINMIDYLARQAKTPQQKKELATYMMRAAHELISPCVSALPRWKLVCQSQVQSLETVNGPLEKSLEAQESLEASHQAGEPLVCKPLIESLEPDLLEHLCSLDLKKARTL